MRILITMIITLFFFTANCQEFIYHAAPKFKNLNFKDGISNLSVKKIEQDELGYIWMATARGLNRYDGITFEHFLFDDENEHSLYHNRTYDLYKSSKGLLFCSTANGVNMFDPKTNQMYRIKSNNEWFLHFIDFNGDTYASCASGGLFIYVEKEKAFEPVKQFDSNIVMIRLVTDDNTGIWGATRDNKFLLNFNPVSGILKKYKIPGNNAPFNRGDIIKINNILLIASENLSAFSLSSGSFIKLPECYKKLRQLKNYKFTFIKEDDKNALWIGTQNKGLFIYNLNQNTFLNYTKENSNLRSNYLTTLFKDRENNIWIGTFNQGADVAFRQKNNINFDLKLENLVKKSFVTSIATDNSANYYIGTEADGLYIYNKEREESVGYFHKDNSFLKSNNIRTLFIDSKNQLWISLVGSLFKTDLEFKNVEEIQLPKSVNAIVSFCEQGGKVIAGSREQGIFVFDFKGNKLVHNKKYVDDVVTKVIPYGKEEVIASVLRKGVFSYNISSNTFTPFIDVLKTKGHKLNDVATLKLDTDSILWIGNYEKGLFKYNLRNNEFNVFTEKDGLSNNDVVCIEEDKNRNLWLATSYGISRFNKKDEFINFFQNEGLNNLQYHRNASAKSNKRLLFFGGNNGLTFFNPELVGQFDHSETPSITLKSISIRNKQVKPNDETYLLSQVLNNTETITLNHEQNIFTIAYHAFDYVAADKIKYAYILEGLDQKWNYVAERTLANYSNLGPGTYTFKVKAQNNIGLWSGVKSLKIVVKPSPFKTPLAYFIYFLVFAVIIYVSFKLVLNAKLYKRELEIEHKERIRENEIAQIKMRFFTNISHEIRTPLTLIRGNTDLLAQSLNSTQLLSDSFKGLQYSTNRLLKLVNQLLSFKSLENDALELRIKKDDLISLTNKLIQPIKYVASSKGITIKIITQYDKLILPIDEDKYEIIMSNLLSNSLKHIQKNGNINIYISPLEINEHSIYFNNPNKFSSSSFVKVAVADNGTGIAPKDLPDVFKRYKQLETDKSKPDYSGTGIGLNFTKRLVELHGGGIIAKSTPNVETIFSFVLSLNASSYVDDEWINDEPVAESEIINETAIKELSEIPDKKLPLILIVEDDLELNRFISSSLKANFRVISCYNGNEGFTLAKEHLPQIVISDIMMPQTDGLELCKMIREDKLISHIPIILLTAKTDEQSEIKGLNHGADDYIIKPFNLSVLKARINNLITLRKNLQQSYKQGILADPQDNIKNQFELKFIKKIDDIVSSEFNSSKLNVNYLADKMNMSRTNFYRKFMNIMDVSPKDFIIKYRINKAVDLIKNGEENFGEISFLCGFGSQSNFSVQFKKEMGLSPLQFKKSLQSSKEKN